MLPQGYEYLNSLGISDELILGMEVGFLDDPEHTFQLLLKSFGKKRLNLAGFLKEDGSFVFLDHQIIFPFFAERQPVFFQARTIRNQIPKEMTLSAPNSWIYNSEILRYLKPGTTVYVTKGPIESLEILETFQTIESIPNFGVVGVHDYSPDSYGQLKLFRCLVC